MDKIRLSCAGLLSSVVLVACDGSPTQNPDLDGGFDAHPLSTMRASVWLDPLGCHHWFLDDGVEGYLSNRVKRDGKPVCTPILLDSTAPDLADQGLASRDTSFDFELQSDAYFNTGSALINEEGLPELQAYFLLLQNSGITEVRIEGHTDSDGTEADNEELSLRRARAVGLYAAQFGVAARAIGKGETEPVAPNDSDENKALNRRVQIYAILTE